jgi:ATP-dependent DNA helicase DinG
LPQKIRNYFTDDAVSALKAAIQDAKGNELFAVGRLDSSDLVESIAVVARGSRSAVPALDQVVAPGEVVIHNHPSGDLTPSEADLRVACRVGSHGAGFLIVSNEMDDVYAVVEVILVRAQRLEEHKNTVRRLLGPSGPIASSLPSYEYRPEQIQMADDVVDAISLGRHALLEAGTGTGKSMAYLVPCVISAQRLERRIVVSTNTINLQEQLVYKDIPFLRSHLGIEFIAALMKGRNNYICLRKVQNLCNEPDTLFDGDEGDEHSQLRALAEMIKELGTGSRSELPIPVTAEVWESICSEPDTCIRAKCPFRESCHYLAARRAAQDADILVVNHHLLLADLSVREAMETNPDVAVLPRYDYAVFDEAHHLPEIVHEYLGDSVTTTQIERTMRRLWRRVQGRSRRTEAGVLVRLRAALSSAEQVSSLARSRALNLIDTSLARSTERVLDLVSELKAHLVKLVAEAAEEDQSSTVRLTEESVESPSFQEVLGDSERVSFVLEEVAAQLKEVHAHILPYEDDLDRIELGLCREIKALSDRAGDFAAVVRAVMRTPEKSFVHWVERTGTAARISFSLKRAPIEIGSRFVDSVLSRIGGTVFTSATLTVQGSFDYFKRRLGLTHLSEEMLIQRTIPSPFDVRRQVMLCVASSLPPPDAAEFHDQLPGILRRLLLASAGRAFVLFTSYSSMRSAAVECRSFLKEHGLRLLVQGEAGRHQLISSFRDDTPSVLFGTDSFWEGVDVRGPSLSHVVIVRLPFRVPTEPLVQAKIESIASEGRDPFLQLSLPEAVIRFRQGFGRLIRSREDTGAVTVLDSRLAQRGYGRAFIESIPECSTVMGTVHEIEDAVRRWLSGENT